MKKQARCLLFLSFFFIFVDTVHEAAQQKGLLHMPKQTIDNYRLTSMEEPTDEVLSQLMREAAEDARRANEAATARFFNEIREAVAAIR